VSVVLKLLGVYMGSIIGALFVSILLLLLHGASPSKNGSFHLQELGLCFRGHLPPRFFQFLPFDHLPSSQSCVSQFNLPIFQTCEFLLSNRRTAPVKNFSLLYIWFSFLLYSCHVPWTSVHTTGERFAIGVYIGFELLLVVPFQKN
jgi:hypothetical protein